LLKGKDDPTASGVGIRGEKTGNEHISGLDEESTVLTNFMDAQRSKINGPNFLGVSCSPVEVHSELPRMVIEKERQRVRALQSRDQAVLYSWAGTTLAPVDVVEVSTRTVGSDEAVGKKDASLNATIKKWRQDNIEKSKSEMKEMTVEVQKRKKAELEAVEMRIKHKKGLGEFRDKLKERLRDRRDPLQGPVMRLFNEDSAQQFMDKFTGYQMSLDAALNMIGAPLGRSAAYDMGKTVVLPTDQLGVDPTSGTMVVLPPTEETAPTAPSWSAARSKESSKMRCVTNAKERAVSPEKFSQQRHGQSQGQGRRSMGGVSMITPSLDALPPMRKSSATMYLDGSDSSVVKAAGYGVEYGDLKVKMDTLPRNMRNKGHPIHTHSAPSSSAAAAARAGGVGGYAPSTASVGVSYGVDPPALLPQGPATLPLRVAFVDAPTVYDSGMPSADMGMGIGAGIGAGMGVGAGRGVGMTRVRGGRDPLDGGSSTFSMDDESTVGPAGSHLYGPAIVQARPDQPAPVSRQGSQGQQGVQGPRTPLSMSRQNVGSVLTSNALAKSAKLPISPYKTRAEALRVYNAGVPSGSAMRVWPAARRKDGTGRIVHGRGVPLPGDAVGQYLLSAGVKTITPQVQV
jgi:hypothetical protein